MAPEEFSRFYEEYADKIYKFIFYRTHHKETAEDLTSKTFLKAFEKLQTFEKNKGQFSTWLYTIARNNVIDHYRTHKETSDLFDILNLAGNEKVINQVSDKLELERVQKYLESLTSEQRDLVIMRIWDGLSYKEIAQITGKSEAACKVMFSRTLSKINSAVLVAILLYILR